MKLANNWVYLIRTDFLVPEDIFLNLFEYQMTIVAYEYFNLMNFIHSVLIHMLTL